MYLLDTNIWLERLLEQRQSEEVRQFLDQIAPDTLFISDFALHSIALALTRRHRAEAWVSFVQDVLVDGAVTLIRLQSEDLKIVAEIMQQQHLDYDDAYQYAIAEKYNLVLVSFDSDFDSTDRNRQTPAQILAALD
jgi:uncharacterized protein